MSEGIAGLVFHPKDCGLNPGSDGVTLKQYNDKIRFVVQIDQTLSSSISLLTYMKLPCYQRVIPSISFPCQWLTSDHSLSIPIIKEDNNKKMKQNKKHTSCLFICGSLIKVFACQYSSKYNVVKLSVAVIYLNHSGLIKINNRLGQEETHPAANSKGLSQLPSWDIVIDTLL